jgi:hypothetical protein
MMYLSHFRFTIHPFAIRYVKLDPVFGYVQILLLDTLILEVKPLVEFVETSHVTRPESPLECISWERKGIHGESGAVHMVKSY